MPYIMRIGTEGIAALALLIPLLIVIVILLPVLIIIILSVAAAAGVASILISGAKRLGKKKESDRKAKGIIDVEYKVK